MVYLEMTVIKDFLKIAYFYYPKNTDSINDKNTYITSKEYIRLDRKINENKVLHVENKFNLINSLNKVKCNYEFTFKDSTYFEWNDRCYTLEYTLKVHDKTFLLKLFISIIAPVFSIKFFLLESNNERVKYKEIKIEEFCCNDLIESLKSLLNDNNYFEINNSLGSKRILDINFDDIPIGEFTFFNTFFNSQNF